MAVFATKPVALFRHGTVQIKLICIHVGFFLLMALWRGVVWLFRLPELWETRSFEWVQLSPDIKMLLQHPWTLITYPFVHLDLWHLGFNMLCLYAFGRIFLQFFTGRNLCVIYILGGIVGGCIFVASMNFFPAFQHNESSLVGASASVLALVVCVGAARPNLPVQFALVGSLRLKYIVGILLAMSLFAMPSGNAGGTMAHLGGVLVGLISAYYLSQPRHLPKKRKQRWPKGGISDATIINEINDHEVKSKPSQSKSESGHVEAIIEKVKRSGYESLTAEEKRILFEQRRP